MQAHLKELLFHNQSLTAYAVLTVHVPHIENYLKAIIIANPNPTTQEHILDVVQVVAHNCTPLSPLSHSTERYSIIRNLSTIYCILISFTSTVELFMLQKTQPFMKNLTTQSSACPIE